MTATKLGGMILLHSAPAEGGACMYCGQGQPWGPMEPCDGPLPLRRRIADLEAETAKYRAPVDALVELVKAEVMEEVRRRERTKSAREAGLVRPEDR